MLRCKGAFKMIMCLVLGSFLLLGGHTTRAADGVPYRRVSVTPILEALELKHYELPNGLQVAIVEDATRPVVTSQIYYRVGSADEPPKRQGLAHLVEHLLHDPAFLDQLNLQGGRHSNASTSRDVTRYYTTIPKHLLDQVLDQFAKDMVSLDVTQEAFDVEKKVVVAEAVGEFNKADQMVYRSVYQQVFSGHPYQYPVIGSHIDSIKTFTLEMARQFHKRYYAPNNACLVVVGDVQSSAVMADVVRFFGKIPPSENKDRNTGFTPTFKRVTQDTVIFQEDAREPTLWTVWPIPAASHSDMISLASLVTVLQSGGSSPSSQIFRNTHLALSTRFSMIIQRDAGMIYHRAVVSPNRSLGEITTALFGMLKSVVDSLSDERMHILRVYERKNLYAMITSQRRLAAVVGNSFVLNGDPSHRIKWMQALDQVTREDIQRVAKTYLIDQSACQFIKTKRSSSSFDDLDPEWIIGIAFVIALVILLVRYYKNRNTWQTMGLLLLFVTSADADIPNHKIYYQHDPRVPQTEISLVYATGGRIQEPLDKSGLLFVLERLLHDRIGRNISPHFDRLGAYVSFAASDLDAIIKVRVFSENLDETLLLVHNFLQDLHFEDDEVNHSRKLVLSTFEKYVDGKRLQGLLHDHLFTLDEHRRMGTRQGIGRVTAEDLNHYILQTRNAQVLYFKVVSDLDKTQIEKSLQIFKDGRLRTGFAPHPKPKRNTISGKRLVIVPLKFSRVNYCLGVSNGLPRQDARWFAQLLLVDALHQFLFYKLREEKGWCYSTGVGLNTHFFPPVIQFYATSPQKNTNDVVPEMYRLIREFYADPMFWARLEKSKARLKQAYFMKYDLGVVLNQQIEHDRDGILPVSVVEYEQAIDRVSQEDLDGVVEAVLDVSDSEKGGLEMIFFGERKKLAPILKRHMPDQKIEIFEPEALKDEVELK